MKTPKTGFVISSFGPTEIGTTGKMSNQTTWLRFYRPNPEWGGELTLTRDHANAHVFATRDKAAAMIKNIAASDRAHNQNDARDLKIEPSNAARRVKRNPAPRRASGSYHTNNPKIDLYDAAGAYLTSTNFSPTVRDAIKDYNAVHPERKAFRGSRVAKRNPSARRVGTSIRKPSMITGRAPSRRLIKRRRKNVKAGFFPNPSNRTARVPLADHPHLYSKVTIKRKNAARRKADYLIALRKVAGPGSKTVHFVSDLYKVNGQQRVKTSPKLAAANKLTRKTAFYVARLIAGPGGYRIAVVSSDVPLTDVKAALA